MLRVGKNLVEKFWLYNQWFWFYNQWFWL